MNLKNSQKPFLWKLKSGERRFILLVGDMISSIAALMMSLYFWGIADAWLDLSSEFIAERTPFWFYFLPLVWVVLILIVELYDERKAGRRREVFRGVLIAAVAYIGLYLAIYFTSQPNSLPRRGVAVFILSASLFTILLRLMYIRVFTAPQFLRRVLIVGAGRAGKALASVVSEIWPPPFYVVGMIDDDSKKKGKKIEGFEVLGNSQDLSAIIEKENISDLIFSISGNMKPEMFQALLAAEEKGVEVTTMPAMYEDLRGRVPIHLLQSDWILRSFVDQAHAGGIYNVVKRLMDILGSVIGLSILVVLFPFLAIFIFLDSGFPVLYKQTRLGQSGREYQMIKFRTMRQDAEKDGKAQMAAKNDQRVTRFGRFLRRSHLDELPQFINVLLGDMSLVGPRAERPQLVEELQNQVPFYRARLLVKPGLTGWAQVNYGYVSTIEGTSIKLEYDLYYIKHRDLMLDISIILRTIGAVIGFRGR